MRDTRQENNQNAPNFRPAAEISEMKEAERKAAIKELEARRAAIGLHCLKELIRIEDLSAYEVARLIGIDAQTIRNWISGKAKPSRLAAAKIKDFLSNYYDKKLASLE